jgi:hypothetical protein
VAIPRISLQKPSVRKSARLEIFSGWKDIANYLRRGVRTVQRYERQLGLPIHRPAGKSTGAVIATKAELDGWVAAGPTRADSLPKGGPTDQANKIGAKFLQVDCDIAITFSGMALQTTDNDKKRRLIQTAHKAYDTIIWLRRRLELNDAERARLDAGLERLKSQLERLGESLQPVTKRSS